MESKPRVLYFDIESCGINALKSDLGFCIIFGYMFEGDARPHAIVIDRKSLRRFDDRKLLIAASKIMAEADLLVGHFSSVFDRRFLQGRLLINKLPPIPPTKMRDTCLIMRSVANYSSNRLKHLANVLELENKKLESNFPDAWFQIMQGDTKVLRETTEYCKGDVLAVRELYHRLLPFDNAHPRIHSDRAKCSVCGGDVQYRGVSFVGQLRYRRYQCNKCGRWDRERKAMGEIVDPND